MFLALRELRFARGRFTLMGTVIALISILVVLLSGLSSGLVNDGVSGLKSMPVSGFVFNEGTLKDNAFSRSVTDDNQLDVWREASEVSQAEPMGVNIVNGVTDDDTQIDLTLFGVDPDGFLSPEVSSGNQIVGANEIVVSETLKDSGVKVGTVFTIDRLETELTVVGFTEGQATFGHVNIAYLPLDTWRLMAAGVAKPGAPTDAQIAAVDFPFASVIALKTTDDSVALPKVNKEAETITMSLEESFNASPGYEAETLTLSMIQIFLYAICALVIGAFFTVWTINRTHDIAVLRAMGASSRYLLRDSLAQATILLVSFTAVGVGLGVAMGAAMPATMPFDLETAPIAVATGLTIGLGLLGATAAVVRITRVDPLRALGGLR